jgi:dihydroorotate dehydrogenase
MVKYESVRSLIFSLSPEFAHDVTMGTLHWLPAPKIPEHDSRLGIRVAGIQLPSPVGLAAGFDKDAQAPGRMLGFGFGSVEVGTVTPEPQPGNPLPRLFRLEEDEAIINRYGFNSAGHSVVSRRLAKRRNKPGIVGVNLGANKASKDRVRDYVLGVTRFSDLADYLTINVSSPNTPGLRDLQQKDQLSRLAHAVIAARQGDLPLFFKISPDLTDSEIADVCSVVINEGISGLIIGNTTTSRPSGLVSTKANENGGLSGKPLKQIALDALRAFYSEIGSKIALIGVGGISSAEDAYERIRAGASSVQLCTSLVYKGPGVAAEINRGLLRLLADDGLESIADAVGKEKAKSRSAKQKKGKPVGTLVAA